LFKRIAAFDLSTANVDTITRAGTAGVIPAETPYWRCPSDGTRSNNCNKSNYIGNGGMQDWSGSWSNCGYDPFSSLYCNGATMVPPHNWKCQGDPAKPGNTEQDNGMFKYA